MTEFTTGTFETKKNCWTKITDIISFNSPVILGFMLISTLALLLDKITEGKSNDLLFSVYRSSPVNPLTYIRVFTHVLGHANLAHYLGNISLLLVIGSLIEEKYGSLNTLLVTLITALITGIAHIIFYGSYMHLLGASGVVFAFILLSSITGFKDNKVPLTFILVVFIYIGQQVYEIFFVKSNVSNITHILGGIVGSVFGFLANKYPFLKRPNKNYNYDDDPFGVNPSD